MMWEEISWRISAYLTKRREAVVFALRKNSIGIFLILKRKKSKLRKFMEAIKKIISGYFNIFSRISN